MTFQFRLYLYLLPFGMSLLRSVIRALKLGQLLARKFDLYGKLTSSIDDKDLLHGYIDGVVQCAYADVIFNILQCILVRKSSTSFYYDQPEPTIADYFVFEAYTAARDYCRKLLPDEEDYQSLVKLKQMMRERPALANYFSKGLLFRCFTGSPKDSEYMARLATIF
ncbi:unnamed protein product [Rotaria magnacalcarata]|uniref:Glutathione S-transferase C-terminal domain-containing protein n=2 Tax=Rotaria magnacalcarata TaxID=392030 RepID=A0A816ZKN8_9BILA|nr:unnamed protein product [Rotaria magnacalcarata]